MTTVIDNLTYTLNSTEATLTGTTYTSSFELIVPDTIETGGIIYTVTYISTEAFLNNTNITAATISNNVTATGTAVFKGCSNLASINLPNNMQYINTQFCMLCTSLLSVTLPNNNITFLNGSCFRGCSSMTSVTFTSNFVSYEASAQFKDCSSLVSIDFNYYAYHVTPPNFLENCTSLTSAINLPRSLNDRLFANCTSLSLVTFKDQARIIIGLIGNNCFENCTSLTSFSNNIINRLESNVFSGCTALTSLNGTFISLNDTVSNQFSDCVALTEVTLLWADTGGKTFPSTFFPTTLSGSAVVTLVDNNLTESYWISLHSFIETNWTTSTISFQTTVNYTTYTQNVTNYELSVKSTTATSNLTIPSTINITNDTTIVYNVVSIEDEAFRDNTLLTGTVTLPDSIITCGIRAFQECTNITNVVLPSTLTNIPLGLFFGCTGLTSINIPSNVTTIDNIAFRDCGSLTGNLILPSSLSYIGISSFRKTAITSVYFSLPFTQSLTIDNTAFIDCTLLNSFYMYGNMSSNYSIGNSTFAGCNALTSIIWEFPNNLVSIGTTPFPSSYSNSLSVTYYYSQDSSSLNSLQQSLQTNYFTPAGASYIYSSACFSQGTLICCYNSDLQTEVNIAVESLQLGDLVKTYLHGYQPVCRFGSARGTNNSINPDKFLNCLHTMKQTDRMTHDLTLVGGHSILVDTLPPDIKKKQEAIGFSQSIDDKCLLLAAFSNQFEKHTGLNNFNCYHFAVGDIPNKRYGIYANGSILCETPSPNSFDSLPSFQIRL